MSPSPPDDLPRVIPVFPLSGVLLLPHGKLPLNIFEPRYLQMTEDAMASHRLIGMVQPVDPADMDEQPAIYPTGCVGRITSFSETDDDRYLIALSGIARFHIHRELPPDGLLYRRVEADFTPYNDDFDSRVELRLDRGQLLPALHDFFDQKGLSANWDAINQSEDGDLLTSLAMVCPFSPSEKQALLECESDTIRADMLIALIEMARHELNAGIDLGAQQ